MTSPLGNPFVFPNLGGSSATNPLLQSLEMMRQAWGGLTQPGTLNASLHTPTLLDPSEIQRKITELQAVENWLQLNLGMLQGSIRALEVQHATLSTLRSFANLGQTQAHSGGDPESPGGPSPLEVALGLKPPPAGGQSAAPPSPEEAADTPAQPQAEATASATTAPGMLDPAQAAAAQQAWWDVLQQQFNQIASAAAATFPAGNSAPPTATPPGAAGGKAKEAKPRAAKKSARKAATASQRASKKTPRR